MMDGRGKSDRPIIPGKPPNNAEEPAAEVAEGRGRTKGNSPERNARRTQGRVSTLSALERVRQAARREANLLDLCPRPGPAHATRPFGSLSQWVPPPHDDPRSLYRRRLLQPLVLVSAQLAGERRFAHVAVHGGSAPKIDVSLLAA